MKNIENVCKAVVNKITHQETDGWPPLCWGIYYQPERPQNVMNKNSEQGNHNQE